MTDSLNVSRETDSKLQVYLKLLHKWQKAINLISPTTLKEAETRHFKDSLQILSLIPEGSKTLYDLGSGGGFPGMVLALAAPEIAVSLIESDRKKCSFISAVSRETATQTNVINQRIEQTDLPAPDVITARALADLKTLMEWCQHWAEGNPDLRMIFPKGRGAEQELQEAKQFFTFDYTQTPSTTSDEASIITVYNLRPKAS